MKTRSGPVVFLREDPYGVEFLTIGGIFATITRLEKELEVERKNNTALQKALDEATAKEDEPEEEE